MGSDQDSGRGTAKDAWLRRQALQLAGQLPSEPEEAFKIIELMGELFLSFMHPKYKTAKREARLRIVNSNIGKDS